ncbi:hypothetical protein BCR39DRAFT_532661 [Naematelia encephala]|uniref:Mitochondrial import inner membrane translocase subunit TIM44 n=1 Tax=Naematelia encephala TaxID=71784 RepID=A0A1Y2B2S0_9TREE|nr:hypothetical protein BCR39DRAFT_532661 [Naematelia encephala]
MKSRPIHLHLLRLRALPPRRLVAPGFIRPISTTPRRLEASKEEPKSESQSQSRRRVPENAPPQSPFKVFIDVFREEIQKNKEWQESSRQLGGEVGKLADSAAMKRGREMYEKARLANFVKSNPRLQQVAADLAKRGMSVRDAMGQALEDSAITDALRQSYGFTLRVTEPLRNTAIYKTTASTLEEVIDDLELGGYEDRDARRLRRQKRAQKAGMTAARRTKADPEAGEALVLSDKQETTSSSSSPSWYENTAAYQRFKENYYESDDALYSTLRTVGGFFGRLSSESDMARVIKAIRAMDPAFRMDVWQRELKEYIVPEVVDAYLSADRDSLKEWMSEAMYNVAWATMGQYIKQGLVSDSRILDIRNVDVGKAMLEEDNIPRILVTFETQELLLFRKAKTGEVVVGSERGVSNCRYGMVLTRVEDQLDNELTGGWRVVEFMRRAVSGI